MGVTKNRCSFFIFVKDCMPRLVKKRVFCLRYTQFYLFKYFRHNYIGHFILNNLSCLAPYQI
jgi:hypothetical protein